RGAGVRVADVAPVTNGPGFLHLPEDAAAAGAVVGDLFAERVRRAGGAAPPPADDAFAVGAPRNRLALAWRRAREPVEQRAKFMQRDAMVDLRGQSARWHLRIFRVTRILYDGRVA